VISIKYQELIQYYEYRNTIEEYSCIKIDEKNNFYYLYNHESSNNSGYAYLICGRIEKDCITSFKKYKQKYENEIEPLFEIFLCENNIYFRKNEDIYSVTEKSLMNGEDFYSDSY